MIRSFKTPRLTVLAIAIALLATACGALSSEPTPSLQELQLTAQASTAQTLTAQAPAPTPIPPTPIPPTPIPTLVEEIVAAPLEIVPEALAPQADPAAVVQPAETESGVMEPDCSGAITSRTEGARAPVHIVNKKGSSILLSYYLEPNAFGQCGSGSIDLFEDSALLNLPQGCYFLYAWVTHQGKDQSFQGYGCNPPEGATWVVFPDRMEAVEH